MDEEGDDDAPATNVVPFAADRASPPGKPPAGEKRKPPNAGKGRPKGSQNKVTVSLRTALGLASVSVGDQLHADGVTQHGGLVGYLEHLALMEPKAFAALLGKLLPVEIQAEVKVSDNIAERLEKARQRTIELEAQRR